MKNFIFATVSSLALLIAAEASAQETGNMGETAPTTPSTENPDSKMMDIKPAPTAPSKEMEQNPDSKMMELKPPVSSKEMTSKNAPKKHKKHQKSHKETIYPAVIKEGYVVYPPINAQGRSMCAPSYYMGNPQCPYQYHGGYFWYPHARGNMLEGYTPYHDTRMYWYPSHMHPHMIYVNRAPMIYVYPHPMDAPLYYGQSEPMRKKWESAPEMHTAEEY